MYKRLLVFTIIFLVFQNLFAQSYLGYTTNTVNFRTGPSTSSKIIGTLTSGTALFVESNQKFDGYYQVLNIDTNEEGYVHSSYVTLERELPKNEDGIFTPVGRTASTSPILKIHNNTSLTLSLKLNGDTYVFTPQERRTLTLQRGSYSYRASAPGVLPDYGTEIIQSNYEYEWSFYISTSRN